MMRLLISVGAATIFACIVVMRGLWKLVPLLRRATGRNRDLVSSHARREARRR